MRDQIKQIFKNYALHILENGYAENTTDTTVEKVLKLIEEKMAENIFKRLQEDFTQYRPLQDIPSKPINPNERPIVMMYGVYPKYDINITSLNDLNKNKENK